MDQIIKINIKVLYQISSSDKVLMNLSIPGRSDPFSFEISLRKYMVDIVVGLHYCHLGTWHLKSFPKQNIKTQIIYVQRSFKRIILTNTNLSLFSRVLVIRKGYKRSASYSIITYVCPSVRPSVRLSDLGGNVIFSAPN